MEDKKLYLDGPFLPVKRFPTKPENSNEPKNTEKKTTTRRKVKDSCQETEHDTLVRLLQNNHRFDHVMGPSSIPFMEESDLIKALGMVSSPASFRVREFKKNEERLSNLARDNTILENHDLIMSIAMKEKKESSLVEEYKKKKKRSIALQRVSMAINQDLQNVDDGDDNEDHNHVYSNVSKKALFGLCSKNSVDVLIPILSRVKTCQNLGVKPEKMVNTKPLNSVNKIRSSSRILRSNQVMTKSQKLYQKPRFGTEMSKVCLSDPGDIIRIPMQRTRSISQIQRRETRFLEEEVKRRRNMKKIRSGNLYETSHNISVSQLPLPKTPSESWLCRTLPRISAASVVSGQAAGFKKMMMDQKSNPKSIKWETIVKTSYKHHALVRYSEELDVVRPSRQSKS